MKISANDIRSGNILLHNNELWLVIKNPEHTKPGKGGAYVQVEMRNIKRGNKLNERFSSTETVEKAFLETKDYQYLYTEDSKFILMDNINFEQIMLDRELLGEREAFLEPSMNVKVEFFEDQALNIELPATVVCEIIETEPVIKGSTVTSTYKPSILQNGIKVMVPPYIETGQKIVVKTSDCTFVERAK